MVVEDNHCRDWPVVVVVSGLPRLPTTTERRYTSNSNGIRGFNTQHCLLRHTQQIRDMPAQTKRQSAISLLAANVSLIRVSPPPPLLLHPKQRHNNHSICTTKTDVVVFRFPLGLSQTQECVRVLGTTTSTSTNQKRTKKQHHQQQQQQQQHQS
uniref:Uncharacterized protein n=1 Tax=Pseudo-nitzschia australis TaxID=44445 RepID=A0A7S4AV99_9STRA|mmetsp:Transcript_2431/g.4885  ORF Transcript_2431/g.4885 Transcript_2431/m.4885 type:complete len:154 (-) Transcript_2431:9-470(-)